MYLVKQCPEFLDPKKKWGRGNQKCYELPIRIAERKDFLFL